MAAPAGPHHAARHQGAKQRRIVAAWKRRQCRARVQDLGGKTGERLTIVTAPEPGGTLLHCRRRQRLGGADMGAHDIPQGDIGTGHGGGKRRHHLGEVTDPRPQVRKRFLVFRGGEFKGGIDPLAQATQARGRARAAQNMDFQGPDGLPETGRLHSAGGKGVLEAAKHPKGHEAVTHHIGNQAKKGPGRGGGQRRTRGIVDLDAPMTEPRRNPAGKPTIGGDQGRGHTRRFERAAHA